MTIDELKSLLSRFHIRPDKSLGQNFLLSEKVLDEIVSAAELKSDDTVLEIGPGLGILTRALAERAGQVIAIEKDRKLATALRKIFRNKKNVKIIHGDALFFDPQTYNLQLTTYKLVANIPYYLTGKLLQMFLTTDRKPSLIVLLLQKEVAQRIVAKPGEMSVLSVSVQFYSDPEIISYVSKENFYPMPEVDSAVVKLKVLDKPRFDVDESKFFQMVKIGFSNKRKMLKNNLANNFTLPPPLPSREGNKELIPPPRGGRLGGGDYEKIFESLNLNPLCRAQDLSPGDWYRLYQKLLT